MDCRESRELMSGAVDNELHGEEAEGFFEHIEICGSCRDEYELEALTKSYIKRKIAFVRVPVSLERAIREMIFSDTGLLKQGALISRPFTNPLFQPVMAILTVVLIGVALFFANRPNLIMPAGSSPPDSEAAVQQGPQDMLIAAMNNFQDVLSGKFKSQITAITSADVSNFVNEKTGESVKLPVINEADWIGGSVSSGGSKAVQAVYKIGEGYIYIYTLPENDVTAGVLSLPPSCASTIKKGEWYWGMDENGDTQAAWTSGSRVFVATTNLDKKDLAGYLKAGGRNPQ